MTALIPDSCWKNIRPKEINKGFKLLRFISSNSAFCDAWRSASQCDFTMPFNSGSTSAFLPRNHCNARRARSSRPRETNHLGVSGISNISKRKGTGNAAPRNASSDQLRYLPTTKHIKMPMLPNAVGRRPSVPLTSGWTVSPRYTGSDREAIPTQSPAKLRPEWKIRLNE